VHVVENKKWVRSISSDAIGFYPIEEGALPSGPTNLDNPCIAQK